MRNFAVKLMMLAMGFGGVTAAAAQGVVAQLQDAGEISAADVGSGKLHFRIENQGNESIHILSWGTPLGDEMTANLFRVEQNGVRALHWRHGQARRTHRGRLFRTEAGPVTRGRRRPERLL
ncbi:hypothetical protein [Rudaea cellulosilytica]|uniref:hypothetical protein n=1 Tax=Rudaea cellulosilytica TaxID=540746 RepID=UPI00146E69F9|nr:hypothetical protein [Rudaea cellulosilytica]